MQLGRDRVRLAPEPALLVTAPRGLLARKKDRCFGSFQQAEEFSRCLKIWTFSFHMTYPMNRKMTVLNLLFSRRLEWSGYRHRKAGSLGKWRCLILTLQPGRTVLGEQHPGLRLLFEPFGHARRLAQLVLRKYCGNSPYAPWIRQLHVFGRVGWGEVEGNSARFSCSKYCPRVGVMVAVNPPVPPWLSSVHLAKCGHSATLREVRGFEKTIYVQHGFCVQADC